VLSLFSKEAGMSILPLLILVVTISIIASAVLAAMNKGKEKKDKGFAIAYHRLSHRRRLIRTLWLLPMTVLLLVWIHQSDLLAPPEFTAIGVLFTIVFIAQISYEYMKWKKHEKAA
jgi:hypothetical protein